MPISQVTLNVVVKRAPFSWATQVTSLLQNRKTVQEGLSNLMSQLPLMDFTDVQKKNKTENRLLNKRMGRGESSETSQKDG